MTCAQKTAIYNWWTVSRDIGWVVGWGWMTGLEAMELGLRRRVLAG